MKPIIGRAGRTSALLLSLASYICASGCLVTHTVRVPVSQKLLAAKTASLDEILALLSNYAEKVVSLSSGSLKVTFTSGKIESGKLQTYRSAPGYILLKRPDSIRLNVQNPITKTSLIELQSVDDSFSLWYPRDNKFFCGKNSTKEFDLEGRPSFTARPPHIFDAIVPQRIPLADPGFHISMEEDQDSVTKYYVLSLFRDIDRKLMSPVRRLWIDRSDLSIARLQVFDPDGRTVSLIRYGRLTSIGGLLLPLSIKIDRPLDGYSLDLEFGSWRLNPDLSDKDFVLSPPPGAEIVELREKGRSGKP